MKMNKSFNKVRLLIITILTLFFITINLASQIFANNSTNITNLLKSSSTNNSYIVEKLKPEKEEVKIEPKEEPKKIEYNEVIEKPKKVKVNNVIKNNENYIEKQKEDIVIKDTSIENIEKEENKKDNNQYITFKADNGRLYYVINTTDKDGNKISKLYTEMSDEKLQALSEGKSKKEIEREKELDRQREELQKEKEELEKLKNSQKEPKKKKSNLGFYILLAFILAGVLTFKKMKDKEMKNSENFNDDENIEELEENNNYTKYDDEEYENYIEEDEEITEDDINLNIQEELENFNISEEDYDENN